MSVTCYVLQIQFDKYAIKYHTLCWMLMGLQEGVPVPFWISAIKEIDLFQLLAQLHSVGQVWRERAWKDVRKATT